MNADNDRDRGETLIELLVSIMIMGTALVVLIGGIGTGIRMSMIHRERASADAYVRGFAEAIQTAVSASPSAYVECAATTSYASAFAIANPNYTATIAAVDYWNGTAFTPVCTVATDTGVQRVSLLVTSTDAFATEHLDIIIRKPCRSTADFPLDAPCT